MSDPGWVRVATLRDAASFRRHLEAGGIPLEFDETLAPAGGPFAKPLEADGLRVGNRFCVLPMEGWDGTATGEPTELTERRWRNFGRSGAKLIWGGEAVAVRHDGRANPHQLMIGEATWETVARLREALVASHEELGGKGSADDLLVGLQLTHSGRYVAPQRLGPGRAARRLAPPAARPPLPGRRAPAVRRGARPAGRRLRPRRGAARAAPASSSST